MDDDPVNIDIGKFLPHRPPMLMVSSIAHITRDSVTAQFRIPADCVFLKNGYLTEAGLLEHAAQAGSAIVGQSYYSPGDVAGTSNKVIGFISSIRSARIHKLPALGTTLVTRADLVSRFDANDMTVCGITCTVHNNGDLIVDCTMNFLIRKVA